MLPDRVSNPGPLTYESGRVPYRLRYAARLQSYSSYSNIKQSVVFLSLF